MRRTTKLALIPVVTVAFIAGLAGSAAAEKASSTVTITKATADTEHVQVRGKVTSSSEACVKNRKVSVYHDVPPAGPSGDDFKFGTVKTDEDGKWELASVALPDKVYAVVKKNRQCQSATSPTVDVKFKP